jgi:nitrogen regulatory protein P-II 1
MIETVVEDEVAEQAVDAIVKAAKTGKIGDGKVFVLPVESAVRIRTEEAGGEAL